MLLDYFFIYDSGPVFETSFVSVSASGSGPGISTSGSGDGLTTGGYGGDTAGPLETGGGS